jgi:hypothetical protein
MDSKIKKLWTRALRGGEYDQGRLFLCLEDKRGGCRFCVLGVLCQLYIEAHRGEGWTVAKTKSGAESLITTPEGYDPIPSGQTILLFGNKSGTLADKVEEWAELRKAEVRTLTRMNDNGISFKKIAVWINKHL